MGTPLRLPPGRAQAFRAPAVPGSHGWSHPANCAGDRGGTPPSRCGSRIRACARSAACGGAARRAGTARRVAISLDTRASRRAGRALRGGPRLRCGSATALPRRGLGSPRTDRISRAPRRSSPQGGRRCLVDRRARCTTRAFRQCLPRRLPPHGALTTGRSRGRADDSPGNAPRRAARTGVADGGRRARARRLANAHDRGRHAGVADRSARQRGVHRRRRNKRGATSSWSERRDAARPTSSPPARDNAHSRRSWRAHFVCPGDHRDARPTFTRAMDEIAGSRMIEHSRDRRCRLHLASRFRHPHCCYMA